MNNEVKPTPTPWRTSAVGRDVYATHPNGDCAICIATCGGYEPSLAHFLEQAKANAAFIVRAVNAHNDMLEALRFAEDALVWYDEEGKVVAKNALKEVRAAIAKAEGRTA